MKLSKRKIELMLVDIAIIICVYYMTALVGILRLHSIVLNGELNLIRLTALVIMLMTGRILCGVYRNVWRYANIETYLTIMVSDFISNLILMLIGRVWFAVNLGIGVHMIVASTPTAAKTRIRPSRVTPLTKFIKWKWPS